MLVCVYTTSTGPLEHQEEEVFRPGVKDSADSGARMSTRTEASERWTCSVQGWTWYQTQPQRLTEASLTVEYSTEVIHSDSDQDSEDTVGSGGDRREFGG